MNELIVKQGEVKPVRITVTKDGQRVDLTQVELTFQVKRRKGDTSALISKSDTDFDKTDAAIGVVWFTLTDDDTSLPPGTAYVGELKCIYPNGMVDKSEDIRVVIQQAVTA